MLFRGQGYGRYHDNWAVDNPGNENFSRVYYICGGDIDYADYEGVKKLQKGFIYVFPVDRPYTIRHHLPNRIHCLWAHVDFLPVYVNRLLEIPVKEGSSLHFMLQSMILHAEANDSNDGFFVSMVMALAEYLKLFHLHTYSRELEEIILFIQQHCLEPISVTDISSRFGYSNEHVVRLFRQKIARTPYQYLLCCKLNEASHLLQNGVSVNETAIACGFNDAKTFSHCFKQKYEMSPTQYIKFFSKVP